MAAGALGSIIDQFDNHDRCLPRRSVRLPLALAPVLFLGAIVLSACAWDPPTIERTPREAAGAESAAKSRLAARKGGAQNGTAASGAAGEKIDVPGDMAALEVDLTNFKERLIGLDSDEINDLMGTPSLERAEPPALIWQYRHQVCTVDIFMFDDGGGSTVDHVDVRPSGGNVTDKDCFTALLRNVPPAGAVSTKAGPPIASAPSTPVGRRPTPSAAPPSGPAQTPSSSRPPVPSTAAPSAAPATPAARAPAAAAIPEGEEGPPPTDTDIDFDFGAGAAPALPGASSNAAPTASSNAAAAARPAPSAAPQAARSSEAIPTLPPEFSDDAPPKPSVARDNVLDGIDMPSAALGGGDDEFADPTDSAPSKAPAPAPAATAKPPAVAAPSAKPAPAPAPLAAVPPASTPAPTVVPPSTPAIVTPPPPSVAAVPTPAPTLAAPSTAPAPLSPRGGTTATAAAQPKGAVKGATKGTAARPVDDVDDEDLPPGLPGLRADDPSRNNQDMVE